MSISPMQLFQMFRSGGNPQQFIQQIMNNSQIMQNPMARNAMDMYQKGDMEGLQTMAQNLAKERGTTVDDVKNNLMRQMNGSR